MSVQLSLLLPEPRARQRDPSTSHDAARKAKGVAASHRNRIMAVLTRPMTIYEIAIMCGLDHVQVARRMIELERIGIAERIPIGFASYASRNYEKRDGCALWRRASGQ